MNNVMESPNILNVLGGQFVHQFEIFVHLLSRKMSI